MARLRLLAAIIAVGCLTVATARKTEFDACDSPELAQEFQNTHQVSFHRVGEQDVIVELTMPTEMPTVHFQGAFLVREDAGTRTLSVLVNSIDEGKNTTWAAFTVRKTELEKYRVFVRYSITPVYPDACWYEFEVEIKA